MIERCHIQQTRTATKPLNSNDTGPYEQIRSTYQISASQLKCKPSARIKLTRVIIPSTTQSTSGGFHPRGSSCIIYDPLKEQTTRPELEKMRVARIWKQTGGVHYIIRACIHVRCTAARRVTLACINQPRRAESRVCKLFSNWLILSLYVDYRPCQDFDRWVSLLIMTFSHQAKSGDARRRSFEVYIDAR